MPRATWNGVVLAESDQGVVVEGNYYFPPESVNMEFFRSSQTHTTCHWKGLASYYDLVVDGQTSKDGAWYYADPSEAAKSIRDYIAFWRGVKVER